MFYVYEWFIVDTGEIIYVGKGTGHRYKVTKRNRFFNDMIKRFKCDSRIVKWFESESDAFQYEYVRVRELKAQNQCVCNIYDGGSGGHQSWWTDELRNKYSANNVMKSEAQRKRMSANNPMKDKSVACRVGKAKSRAVIIDGIEYPSVKAAREAFGVCWDAIRKWCVNGVTYDGKPCQYKDGKLKTYKVQGNQKPSPTNPIKVVGKA